MEPWHYIKYNRFKYLTFITAHSRKQIPSALLTWLQVFIWEGKSTTYIYTMSVPRTGNRRLVGASASSMLSEGDWSHVEYMTLLICLDLFRHKKVRHLTFFLNAFKSSAELAASGHSWWPFFGNPFIYWKRYKKLDLFCLFSERFIPWALSDKDGSAQDYGNPPIHGKNTG